MTALIVSLIFGSIVGGIVHSVCQRDNQVAAVRGVRGFVVGLIIGMGLTLFVLIVRFLFMLG